MIRLAEMNDLLPVKDITEACGLFMETKGIYQWNRSYPSLEVLRRDIEMKELYVYVEKKKRQREQQEIMQNKDEKYIEEETEKGRGREEEGEKGRVEETEIKPQLQNETRETETDGGRKGNTNTNTNLHGKEEGEDIVEEVEVVVGCMVISEEKDDVYNNVVWPSMEKQKQAMSTHSQEKEKKRKA